MFELLFGVSAAAESKQKIKSEVYSRVFEVSGLPVEPQTDPPARPAETSELMKHSPGTVEMAAL